MSVQSDERVVRRMTIRSLTAVGLLVALVIGGFLIFRQQTQTLESTEQVINLSGRQRMLSQRAVLLAEGIVAAEGPESRVRFRRGLLEVAQSMETTHDALLNGDADLGLPPNDLPTVRAIYFEPPYELDRQMKHYLELLKRVAESDGRSSSVLDDVDEIRATATDETLLECLDAVVMALSADSDERLRGLQRAQVGILALILVVLLLTVSGIFLPLARDLRRHLRNLRASQERFRQVADNIREVFWLYNVVEHRVTYVSSAYSEIWGRRISRLLDGAIDWLEPVHPSDRGRVAELFRRAEAGLAFEDHYRIVRSDGAVRWIYDRAFPVHNEDGEVVRIAGLAEDVTERRGAAEKLREQAAELRLTFENAPAGIASCDMNGRILSTNQAFCDALGYDENELLGQREIELTHPDNVDETARTLRLAARGDLHVFTLEKRYVRKNGRIVHGLVRGSVVPAADGSPRRLILQLEDRTERLEAEREAQEQRDRLAHVTRMATMGEMAAGIAHEVNQPLTAITTFADACRRIVMRPDGDSRLVAETLVKMREQAHRAGEVIRRLRSMVKRRGARAEVTDLNELTREAVDLAQADARVHNLKIDFEMSPDLPPIVVDRIQIQQVLLNLLRNSVEALDGDETGGAPIEIATMEHAGGVRVAVRDRGPGVDPEISARVFEPFFSTKETGLGMGLSISQSIVTNHGGELACEPRSGGGTCFYLDLPRAAAVDDELLHGAA